MSAVDLSGAPVLVIGAGIMGAGIAQVAAQAGHAVWLHDARAGAAFVAKDKLTETFAGLVGKGKLTQDAADTALARLTPIDDIALAADARLAIEAIVEQAEPKRTLFRQLQQMLAAEAVIATNTSSISVTALSQGLAAPERLVGMHFFNPVPLMKLVEVVSGLHTAPDVAQAVFHLAAAWGKTPVHAASTPGFIVNRIARPFYAETLALLQERAAPPEVLDACLRAAGFRMGPCELMDLIGHDINLAVTRSVFDAFFCDARYTPSPVQRDMVDGGLLGRKSGRGFYRYPQGAPALPPAPEAKISAREVTIHGRGPIADALAAASAAALAAQGWGPARDEGSDWVGLDVDGARLQLTDGRTAHELSRALGQPDVAVFDRPLVFTPGSVLAYSAVGSAAWQAQAGAWLALLGHHPLRMADTPGLVVARTIAMIVNEAADAVQQGVCDEAGANAAMRLGVNYPAGPFDWLAGWSAAGVLGVLRALDACYAGARYRASPWLQRQG